MITYGKGLTWTDKNGCQHSVSVSGHTTAEDAVRTAWDVAMRTGWQKPRWWEFRRRMREEMPPADMMP